MVSRSTPVRALLYYNSITNGLTPTRSEARVSAALSVIGVQALRALGGARGVPRGCERPCANTTRPQSRSDGGGAQGARH